MSKCYDMEIGFTQLEVAQLASWLRCYPVEGMDFTRNRLLKMLEDKLAEASK